MTCSSCGTNLNPDARFCIHCGARVLAAQQFSPYMRTAPSTQYNRVAQHLQVLSVLWLVYAGARVIEGIFGVAILHGIFGSHHVNFDVVPFGSSWFSALVPLVAAKAIVNVAAAGVTGWALLTRQSWGRILAIVVAIFSLLHPILGTALGIYTLWVLAPAVCGAEYAAVIGQPHRAL